MARVVLINPSYSSTYGSAKASISSPVFPTLGLATIAATAEKAGHKVSIVDLSHQAYDHVALKRQLTEMQPDFVGITATTPLMNQLRDISCLVKDISRDIVTIGGGAQPSALRNDARVETRLRGVRRS
jgi:anaerobic magnesium-protoporphyrin IX monomethyl ester cyclase